VQPIGACNCSTPPLLPSLHEADSSHNVRAHHRRAWPRITCETIERRRPLWFSVTMRPVHVAATRLLAPRCVAHTKVCGPNFIGLYVCVSSIQRSVCRAFRCVRRYACDWRWPASTPAGAMVGSHARPCPHIVRARRRRNGSSDGPPKPSTC